MTQSHLATMCDVDIRTIQRIEKGQQNISLTLLLSLINVLETNVNSLLGDLTNEIKNPDNKE
jgi:DNA-binding XRE family transcriptional regulator